MKLYRCIDFFNPADFEIREGKFWALPKPFAANEDSTIPAGNWSFWFDQPAKIGNNWGAILVAEFEPVHAGVMTFRDFRGDEHSIAEYVTNQPIEVELVMLEDLLSIEGCLIDLVKRDYKSVHGEEFVAKHLRYEFPHFTEGERYYRGYGVGNKPYSFREAISGYDYEFDYYDTLSIETEWFDPELPPRMVQVSLDLLTKFVKVEVICGARMPLLVDIVGVEPMSYDEMAGCYSYDSEYDEEDDDEEEESDCWPWLEDEEEAED